jgi:hypothetical protein
MSPQTNHKWLLSAEGKTEVRAIGIGCPPKQTLNGCHWNDIVPVMKSRVCDFRKHCACKNIALE